MAIVQSVYFNSVTFVSSIYFDSTRRKKNTNPVENFLAN